MKGRAGLVVGLAALCVLLAAGQWNANTNIPHFTELQSQGDALGVEGRDLGWAGGIESGRGRRGGRYAREGVVSQDGPQLDKQALSKAISMGLKQAWAGSLARPSALVSCCGPTVPGRAPRPLPPLTAARPRRVMGNPGGLTACDAACLADMFKRVSRPVASRFSALAHPGVARGGSGKQAGADDAQLDAATPQGVAAAYRDVGINGFAPEVIPQVMGELATYAPLAVAAEKRLAGALAKAGKWGKGQRDGGASFHRRGGEEIRSQLQFGQRLHDEYDAAGQRRIRTFGKGDAPRLVCGEGRGKSRRGVGDVGRFGDCELRGGRDYNRMWYLDRERANKVASAAEVRQHARGVARLAAQWKHLLVGAGGGSGPGAFDSPYWFCYDQYQEDPDFSACLRDLAESKDEMRCSHPPFHA